MMVETWLPVNGYEGIYEVSNLGRVRSLDRIAITITGRPSPRKGRNLVLALGKHGYPVVTLCNKTQKMFSVHRLVAIAFIPNPENKPSVNHIDGDKANNSVNNLEWVTASENTKHAYANNLMAIPKGEKHYNSKLTPELVLRIKSLSKAGHSSPVIVSILGIDITERGIRKVLNGKSWKHLLN
jgi:hypothetical protein